MTAVLRVLDIIFGVIFLYLPVGIVSRARGVEGGALLALRWKMRQIRVDFGHMSGSPEVLWPISWYLT